MTSNFSDDQQFWKKIWKIKAPNKMKTHVLELILSLLSSISNLGKSYRVLVKLHRDARSLVACSTSPV
jgi:hypothetical protein